MFGNVKPLGFWMEGANRFQFLSSHGHLRSSLRASVLSCGGTKIGAISPAILTE